MIFSPSQVDTICLDGAIYRVKRDDLLSPEYSGNKIRKLYALFFRNDLKHLVSYGGYQSNAMLSMAYFAKSKQIRFTYITKPLPDWVKEMREGNYHLAKEAGMENIEVFHSEYASAVASLTFCSPEATVIHQGAATPLAEAGVKLLADELNAYVKEQQLKEPLLLLPSGTGATALYLAKHAAPGIRVVTTPCVGNETYLRVQWSKLESNPARFPEVIHTKKKHHFAKPYPELLEVWEKLYATGIEFDMVYAPKTWLAFLENREKFEGKTVIYIHTGGVPGNTTQRLRYEHKKMC